jgi:hypothetical protein
MRSRHAIRLMIALAATAFVASTPAQDTAPPREVPGVEQPPADLAPDIALDRPSNGSADVRPAGDPLLSSLVSTPAPNPALKQLRNDEVALERQVNSLIRQLGVADADSRRGEIKAKLGEALGRQFDVRQRRHGLEIEGLEARVKKLKDLVQKRQENRMEIISGKLNQIVRESQGLGF